MKVQRKAKIQSKSTLQTLPQKLEGFVGDGRELSVIVIGQNLRPGIGPSVVLGFRDRKKFASSIRDEMRRQSRE